MLSLGLLTPNDPHFKFKDKQVGPLPLPAFQEPTMSPGACGAFSTKGRKTKYTSTGADIAFWA